MSEENFLYHPSSGKRIPYSLIRHAMADQGLAHYTMSLVGKTEKEAVIDAVNEGIDSHLEACYCPDRGDDYGHGERSIDTDDGLHLVHTRTLECKVSAESLPVLLRRLTERFYEDDDEAQTLPGDILQTLGIGEDGKYEKPED